ncbi:IS21 family transposase [Streptacidiphilus sp. EB129]|uniref:Mu transposase domain-containing protein n=1 Tax=Streptacidiphilus sp. EB129 TaxID=3156262 RepID=UPI0035126D3C
MLTREEYDEAYVLRSEGWSVSAIARHLCRDRKTVRSYLEGRRKPGVRLSPEDSLQRYVPYCRQRLSDAVHLPARDLFDEIVELGYTGGYSTLTRALRKHRLRPLCPLCCRNLSVAAQTRDQQGNEHVYFTILRLLAPPPHWGWGTCAYLTVARLSSSSRWRAVLVESDDFPYVVEAIHETLRRLGGTGSAWSLDPSMAAGAGKADRVMRDFVRVADYYDVTLEIDSPTSKQTSQLSGEDLRQIMRAWRTISSTCPLPTAQDRFDQLTARLDVRRTPMPSRREANEQTRLLPLPDSAYPAQIRVMRSVTPRGLVPFRGNTYAVPSDLAGTTVEVRWRIGESHVSIATAGGALITRHALAPPGARRTVTGSREPITPDRRTRPSPRPHPVPCRGGGYLPPSPAALAEAQRLRSKDPTGTQHWPNPQARVCVSDGAPEGSSWSDRSPDQEREREDERAGDRQTAAQTAG